jgi:hypothetical protein
MVSFALAAAGCNRAAASDQQLGAQLVDSAAAPARPVEARPAVEVERTAAPAPAPAPERVVTQTHSKRDAAIGAGVGAAVGAIANGDNRVKGGVVGGLLGGAAGAIVGKTVDKTKKVER